MNINDEISAKGHHLRFKGGFALRLCLQDQFDVLFNKVPHNADRNIIRSILMDKYASPSDLDSTIMIKDNSNDTEWEDVAKIVLRHFETLREDDSWLMHCQNIVNRCNEDIEGLAQLKASGIRVDKFAVQEAKNMKVSYSSKEVNDANPECQKGCITLERVGQPNTTYSSENNTLSFALSNTQRAMFDLLRVKFAIQCTYNDNCVCMSAAELIDVSIPRKGDHHYDTYWDSITVDQMYIYQNRSAGISVAAVNLQYQLDDHARMIEEVLAGMSAHKLVKRLHRYFILSMIHNIIFDKITMECIPDDFDSIYNNMVIPAYTDLNIQVLQKIKSNEIHLDSATINALCSLQSLRAVLDLGPDTKLFWKGGACDTLDKVLQKTAEHDLGGVTLTRQLSHVA